VYVCSPQNGNQDDVETLIFGADQGSLDTWVYRTGLVLKE